MACDDPMGLGGALRFACRSVRPVARRSLGGGRHVALRSAVLEAVGLRFLLPGHVFAPLPGPPPSVSRGAISATAISAALSGPPAPRPWQRTRVSSATSRHRPASLMPFVPRLGTRLDPDPKGDSGQPAFLLSGPPRQSPELARSGFRDPRVGLRVPSDPPRSFPRSSRALRVGFACMRGGSWFYIQRVEQGGQQECPRRPHAGRPNGLPEPASQSADSDEGPMGRTRCGPPNSAPSQRLQHRFSSNSARPMPSSFFGWPPFGLQARSFDPLPSSTS